MYMSESPPKNFPDKKMDLTYATPRPVWLKDHPEDFIFHFEIGTIWYRPTVMGFEIDHIEIPEAHRGQGWGQKLLKAFVDHCKQKSKKPDFEIWLEVSSNNLVAQKLYSKIGFTQVNLRSKYYQDQSDAVVMTLKING